MFEVSNFSIRKLQCYEPINILHLLSLNVVSSSSSLQVTSRISGCFVFNLVCASLALIGLTYLGMKSNVNIVYSREDLVYVKKKFKPYWCHLRVNWGENMI